MYSSVEAGVDENNNATGGKHELSASQEATQIITSANALAGVPQVYGDVSPYLFFIIQQYINFFVNTVLIKV